MPPAVDAAEAQARVTRAITRAKARAAGDARLARMKSNVDALLDARNAAKAGGDPYKAAEAAGAWNRARLAYEAEVAKYVDADKEVVEARKAAAGR
jgi:hypothetical protein